MYNAQRVPIERRVSGGGSTSFNRLFDAAGGGLLGDGHATALASTAPAGVYEALPALVLVAAGVLVAFATFEPLELPEGIVIGASITAGYLPMTVVGIVAFEHAANGVTTAPALAPAVAIAGLAYPLLCGGIGGFVRAWWS